jgi:hypothetical protein
MTMTMTTTPSIDRESTYAFRCATTRCTKRAQYVCLSCQELLCSDYATTIFAPSHCCNVPPYYHAAAQ